MYRAAIAALPALAPKAMDTLTGRSPCPVATYRSIVAGIAAVDLRAEDAEPVRRRFNAYYGVRRNAIWRGHFYERFEAAKTAQLPGDELFADVVRGIEGATGRVEASFASKLVATLRPERPIIDSVVRKWLAPHSQTPPFKGGAAGVTAYYSWLCDFMFELSRSREAQNWSEEFEAAFPTPSDQAEVPVMKRLDFLIWAGAER